MANGHGGTRPNSGRKPKGEIEELQRILDEAVPYEERVDAMRVLLARAKSSDVGALKLLLGYLYGTPVQRQAVEANITENRIIVERNGFESTTAYPARGAEADTEGEATL